MADIPTAFVPFIGAPLTIADNLPPPASAIGPLVFSAYSVLPDILIPSVGIGLFAAPIASPARAAVFGSAPTSLLLSSYPEIHTLLALPQSPPHLPNVNSLCTYFFLYLVLLGFPFPLGGEYSSFHCQCCSC